MIAALSRFRDWLVIDGEQGGPTPPTYRAYFLRITLHGRDDGIVVGMMLVDQADSRCVWAERQTATLDGMAALHQTALRHLAVALNVHLSAPRLQSAREIGSADGAQVRAVDAGTGADGRVARGLRGPRRARSCAS